MKYDENINFKINDFYMQIEEGVRDIVFELRNEGINTEDSCHHEGYIQCQSLDATSELGIIEFVMGKCNIEDYTIELLYQHGKSWNIQSINIKSDKFKIEEENHG